MSPRLELAVQDDAVLLWDRGALPREQGLDVARRMGATWVRFNVYASYVKAYGLAPYDLAIARANAHGLQVQLTLTGQPKWHTDHPAGGVPLRNPDPTRYALYVAELVEHFRNRVSRYSMWNEPNHPTFLQVSPGRSAAELYGRLYRAGYNAAYAAYPGATVLFGELAGAKGAPAFLAAATRKRCRASGVAIHPYSYLQRPDSPKHRDSYEWGHLRALRDHLRSLAHRGLLQTRSGAACPIYVTEFGYHRRPGDKRTIPEGRRAAYTGATVEDARELGLRQYLWYHLINAPADAAWDSGIVGHDGVPSSTYRELAARFA